MESKSCAITPKSLPTQNPRAVLTKALFYRIIGVRECLRGLLCLRLELKEVIVSILSQANGKDSRGRARKQKQEERNDMKRKQTTISGILVLILLCISCSKGTSGSGTNSSDINGVTNGSETVNISQPAATETEEKKLDALPELDYDGTTIVIHTRGDSVNEIYTDGMTGNIVNDIIYERNTLVEDRLNIKIEVFEAEGWQKYDQSVTSLVASIYANDSAFDLIAGWSARIPSLSMQGCLHNLSELEYLDMESPWWNQTCRTELQLGDHVYFLTGDASMSFLTAMSVFAVNQKVAVDNGVENLYDVVKEHRWTIDYVNSLTRNFYTDLNGNGEIDPKDGFGLTTSSVNDVDGYLQGFHATMSVRGEDGYPQFSPDREFLGSIAEKVYELTWGNPGCLTNTGDTTDLDCFKEDRALLAVTRIGDVTSRFADMESDYGVLPYPLFNEFQDTYGTRVQDGVSLWCVPIDAHDAEMSGAVLEAFGSQSYRTVTPEYFDVVLKNRYSRDPETAEMMDLVKNSVWITFDSLYNESIGYPWHYLRYMMMAKTNNFSSFWAACENAYVANYEKTIVQLKELD